MKPCKPPNIEPCDKKVIPSLQECAKPNLMDECPKPDCKWEDGEAASRKKNKLILIVGLIVAALSVGSLLFYFNSLTPKEVVKKEKVAKKSKKIRKAVPVKIPINSKETPNDVPYLLIGGGTAALSAFRAIESSDHTAKILVISNDGTHDTTSFERNLVQ